MSKKKALSFALVFALAMQIFAMPFGAAVSAAPKTVKAKAVKTGLQKVGKKIYYYDKKGKKVKSAWKTVKGNRYYFSKTGAACTGYKKIKADWYYFDQNCRMVREKVVKIKGGRYYFMANGKAPKRAVMLKNGRIWKTNAGGKLVKNITGYAKANKGYDAFQAVAGKPLKSKRFTGCAYGVGTPEAWHYYDNFMVDVALNPSGAWTVIVAMEL